MNDYISRDDVIKMFQLSCSPMVANYLIEAINSLPLLIRCKDCKWWMAYHDYKHGVEYSLCSNPQNMRYDTMLDVTESDYCSRAERREEE